MIKEIECDVMLLTLSNGRVIFIEKDSILDENDDVLYLDATKSFDVMVRQVTQNQISYMVNKISENILKPNTMNVFKSHIIHYDTIDKDNPVFKAVVKSRSNLVLSTDVQTNGGKIDLT